MAQKAQHSIVIKELSLVPGKRFSLINRPVNSLIVRKVLSNLKQDTSHKVKKEEESNNTTTTASHISTAIKDEYKRKETNENRLRYSLGEDKH